MRRFGLVKYRKIKLVKGMESDGETSREEAASVDAGVLYGFRFQPTVCTYVCTDVGNVCLVKNESVLPFSPSRFV